MRYSGSKRRFMRSLEPIITKELRKDDFFIDLFGGGMNVVGAINHPDKIAVDNNKYIIALWKELQTNGMANIPEEVSEEEYYDIKQNYIDKTGKYPDYLIGYVGAALSYGGAWFNGYAKYNPKKNENHVREAYNGLKTQVENFYYLKETKFCHFDYKIPLYPNMVIYCDPPYAATKQYESDFDNDAFWEWVRETTPKVKALYVSEYDAPKDFKCIWKQVKKDGMGTTKQGRKQKTKVEKLFVLK